MKKYLKEIEVSSYILLLIGVIGEGLLHQPWGLGALVIGLLIWVLQVVYKAFKWQEYSSDNRKNIGFMITAILFLLLSMLIKMKGQ